MGATVFDVFDIADIADHLYILTLFANFCHWRMHPVLHSKCALTLEPHPKKLTLLASGVRLDPKAVVDFQSKNIIR